MQTVEITTRVYLHVPVDLQHLRSLGDERRVGLSPIRLELLSAQVRLTAEAEGQLDHEKASSPEPSNSVP